MVVVKIVGSAHWRRSRAGGWKRKENDVCSANCGAITTTTCAPLHTTIITESRHYLPDSRENWFFYNGIKMPQSLSRF